MKRSASSVLIIFAGVVAAVAAYGEDFTATAISIPAPKQISAFVPCVTTGLEAMTEHALIEELEDELADHHRRVPALQLPGPAPLDDLPPIKPPETAVRTDETSRISLRRNEVVRAVTGRTSMVNEPTAAARSADVLYTGNWYAALSRDGGQTFTCINPYKTFPRSPNNQSFCCDQLAAYDAQRDLMVWLLQYSRKDNNGVSKPNVLRVAVATGNDITAGRWRYYDLAPPKFGWIDEWFDYPDVMVGPEHLYITTNAFETTGGIDFTRSVVFRLPLANLQRYEAFTAHYLSPRGAGTLRLARGSANVAYWATHAARSGADYLRVFRWPHSGQTVSTSDVRVQDWKGGSTAAGPDGYDWLRRSDGRLTAGWLANNLLGFSWTAGQDGTFKYPHARVTLIRTDRMEVDSQPHIWNSAFAFAYPSVAPNRNGAVGISISYGGARIDPSHAVGVLDTSAGGASSWELVRTAAGTDGPASEKWGDYQSVSAHGVDADVWAASGFALDGGSSEDDIEPRYIEFTVDRTPVILSDLTVAHTIEDADRLVAIIEQQPENDAAVSRIMARLRLGLSSLRFEGSGADSLKFSDAHASILDTHRPTPTDTKIATFRKDILQRDVTRSAETALAALNHFETVRTQTEQNRAALQEAALRVRAALEVLLERR